MHLNLVLCLSVCGLCSAFFLFKEKKKPLIFCLKICPLYCPKHSSERQDLDASSLIYIDNKPYIAADTSHDYGHDSTYQWKSNPTPKSTIAPTSENPMHPEHGPYFIEEGSGEYIYHPPSGYHKAWKPKPTQKPTVAPTTTTKSPIHVDHYPYIIGGEPDYEYLPHFYKHWGPQSTKPTTTKPTTTTEQPYLDHPYFIEDWPEYEHPAPRYYEWPHPTTSTTAAPTTTEEPTYICGLCAEKCYHKS